MAGDRWQNSSRGVQGGAPVQDALATSTALPARWECTRFRSIVLSGALLLVTLAGACGTDPRPARRPPQLDRQTFREQVEPVLLERCGNPSCHGTDTRPFALYARRANRRDPEDVYRDPPLTDREHRANYDRARSFAVGCRPGCLTHCTSGCFLLTKPLDSSVSGVRHQATSGTTGSGGVVFRTPRHPDFRRLRRWVSGGGR
ncbi:MAG: hypothetical protein ABEL76_11285 [Bradymonadaceae bacterium]